MLAQWYPTVVECRGVRSFLSVPWCYGIFCFGIVVWCGVVILWISCPRKPYRTVFSASVDVFLNNARVCGLFGLTRGFGEGDAW